MTVCHSSIFRNFVVNNYDFITLIVKSSLLSVFFSFFYRNVRNPQSKDVQGLQGKMYVYEVCIDTPPPIVNLRISMLMSRYRDYRFYLQKLQSERNFSVSYF